MSMLNRMGNAKNSYQGQYRKVLTVCSAGLLRSPTTAWLLSQPPFLYNTRCAGANREYALVPVDEVLIHWADEIVFMEMEHFDSVNQRFEKLLANKKVVILDVPDQYPYRDPELVEIIRKQYVEMAKAPD